MTERGLALSPADLRLLRTRAFMAHDVGDDATVKSLMARLLEVVPLTTPEPDPAQASTAIGRAKPHHAGGPQGFPQGSPGISADEVAGYLASPRRSSVAESERPHMISTTARPASRSSPGSVLLHTH